MAAQGVPVLHAVAGTEGPPILLLHGFGADRLSWLANQQELASVGRVFSLDLPGHGETPLVGDGTLGELVAAVEGSLDGAGLGRAHIVGHSLGGAVAIQLAAARPDLARSLVLIASAGLGGGIDEAFLREYPKLDDPEATLALLQRLVSRPRLINRFMVARVLDQLSAPGFRDGLTKIADAIVEINDTIQPSLDALATKDPPRLGIWGGADSIVPIDEAKLARFCAECSVLPGVAHLPQVEAVRDVNERLVAWIKALA